MQKPTLTLFTFLVFQLLTFAQQEIAIEDGKAAITKLEIPNANPDKIISHQGYSVLYNETHQQADWVAYILTKEKTKKLFNRINKFIPDPKIKTCITSDKDYAHSGYDRGHLAPAADMCWSATAIKESFYYSNMSPQQPGFNRGAWKKLEEQVRKWAIENDSIYIVTGPVLSNALPTISTSSISIPEYFYKVILDYKEPGIKGIGFILPNTTSKEPLQQFAVTIDSVEKFTGIDFFPLLPDYQEKIIEKTLCMVCWWDSKKITDIKYKSKPIVSGRKSNDVNNKKISKSLSVQCSRTTKSGNRCKRMTKSSNGRCYQH
ncbi:MAG: DNA/RNA non-specific endonuclease [Chitinophagaceae bacterium]|nr:DNA/RNA non-specific endonuclease [Chitinophagaceae bacterium]